MILYVALAALIAALGFAIYWHITAPAKPKALADIDALRKGKSTGQSVDKGTGNVEIKKVKDNVVFRGALTLAEIARHNTRKDCWIIVDGKVYDVTTYIDLHPGGDAIMNNAGADSSVGFHGEQHPITVANIIADYLIGEVAAPKKDE